MIRQGILASILADPRSAVSPPPMVSVRGTLNETT
ncbi:hypothetical protein EDD27_4342 [Nonomuraea polychroma]|uniref:Uncharacterized protein n=1 Tax=Nonomuraea polychroma TaxID=46176 RepID=A0A438M7S3_9ACTN|nr:hypothetical protein EDD27_4342 [Nonomuraea polychroma]